MMYLRTRRAAMPLSISASTTIRWSITCCETICSPPANRKVADNSARRQHGRSTCRRASSSFTCAVNDIEAIFPLMSHPLLRRRIHLYRPRRGAADHVGSSSRCVGPGEAIVSHPVFPTLHAARQHPLPPLGQQEPHLSAY